MYPMEIEHAQMLYVLNLQLYLHKWDWYMYTPGKYRDWYPSSHNHGSVENYPNLYTKQVLGEPVSNFHDYARVYVHSGTLTL